MNETPRIYVADLAAYNAGELVGEWIELSPDTHADDIYETVDSILRRGEIIVAADVQDYVEASPHEEYAIHDYEGFGPIRINEYDSFGTILEHVERMADDPDRYFAYLEHCGEHYADGYDPGDVIGPWDSMLDIAYEHVESYILPDIPDGARQTVENYFDFEAFARDLEMEGSFIEYAGKVYEIVG